MCDRSRLPRFHAKRSEDYTFMHRKGKPRALELFCGRGSVRRALEARGFLVTSVDIDPKARAIFTENIMHWQYQRFRPGFFTVISASPPYEEYSRVKTIGERNLEKSDRIVLRTL